MPDEYVLKAIEEIAAEKGLTKKMVTNCVRHVCDWTRQSLINMDYIEIYWAKFGKFKLMPNKVYWNPEVEEKARNYFKNKRKGKTNELQNTSDKSDIKQCSEDNE